MLRLYPSGRCGTRTGCAGRPSEKDNGGPACRHLAGSRTSETNIVGEDCGPDVHSDDEKNIRTMLLDYETQKK